MVPLPAYGLGTSITVALGISLLWRVVVLWLQAGPPRTPARRTPTPRQQQAILPPGTNRTGQADRRQQLAGCTRLNCRLYHQHHIPQALPRYALPPTDLPPATTALFRPGGPLNRGYWTAAFPHTPCYQARRLHRTLPHHPTALPPDHPGAPTAPLC